MRRIGGRGLSSGTSPERIAPESVTPLHSGFVHRNISRRPLTAALDQVWHGSTRAGLAVKSLNVAVTPSRIRSEEESTGFRASFRCSPSWREAKRRSHPVFCRAMDCFAEPVIGRAFARPVGSQSPSHCVFATRGGVAVVMNWVASSIAVPSGVGITIRNGTRTRVPATGAKAISILRWLERYLITGRSGM
jgi:hypothetical protein